MANKWLDNLIDLWNRLTATRASYLDELDFDLNARLGTPAGASLAADLLTIDNLVDDLEARLTLARAGYLDNINNAQLLNITAARLGYIDLLADATVGLAAIEALVDDLETAVGAIQGATTLHNKLTAARAALLDQITALRMAELDAANLPADVDTLLTRLSAARAGYLDNLSGGAVALAASWTAALATALGNYTAARAAYLDELAAANIPADIDAILADTGTAGVVVNDRTPAYERQQGVEQVIEVSITSAANAGLVTVATITTQPCLIEEVVIHADTAQTANMTSCAVLGGAAQVVTFISATDAVQANLNAADKQVAWRGAVRLAATKTIVISLVGTGAAAVDLTITIKYRAAVNGGYLV